MTLPLLFNQGAPVGTTTDEYCLRQDVVDRFRQSGIKYLADDNLDDIVDNGELQASVDASIRRAARVVDMFIQPWFRTPIVQNVDDLNQWLRDRTCDLAACYLASRGGTPAPQAFTDICEQALAWLADVHDGDLKIPSIVYPGTDEQMLQRIGEPRVSTPHFIQGKRFAVLGYSRGRASRIGI